jgi:hypothetical protein
MLIKGGRSSGIDRRHPRVLARRIVEIHAENEVAAASVQRCARCGCSKGRPCVVELPDDAGTAQCAPPGEVPGHPSVCSRCVKPEPRKKARR